MSTTLATKIDVDLSYPLSAESSIAGPFNSDCNNNSNSDSDSSIFSIGDDNNSDKKDHKEDQLAFKLNYSNWRHEWAYLHLTRIDWHKPATANKIVRYYANCYNGIIGSDVGLQKADERTMSITKEVQRVIMDFVKLLYTSYWSRCFFGFVRLQSSKNPLDDGEIACRLVSSTAIFRLRSKQ